MEPNAEKVLNEIERNKALLKPFWDKINEQKTLPRVEAKDIPTEDSIFRSEALAVFFADLKAKGCCSRLSKPDHQTVCHGSIWHDEYDDYSDVAPESRSDGVGNYTRSEVALPSCPNNKAQSEPLHQGR